MGIPKMVPSGNRMNHRIFRGSQFSDTSIRWVLVSSRLCCLQYFAIITVRCCSQLSSSNFRNSVFVFPLSLQCFTANFRYPQNLNFSAVWSFAGTLKHDIKLAIHVHTYVICIYIYYKNIIYSIIPFKSHILADPMTFHLESALYLHSIPLKLKTSYDKWFHTHYTAMFVC